MELIGLVFSVVVNIPLVRAETVEPSFDVPMINVTAIKGKTAVLPCSVSLLGEHKVVWLDHREKILTLGTRRIISDQRITVERPFTSDWNLYIHEVNHTDAGKYMCQINTDPVKIKDVMLYVFEPPQIIDDWSSSDVVARETETVQLICNVTGVPPPTVTWFRRPSDKKDGFKQSNICGTNSAVGSNGEVLVIHNISRYCEDLYECVAFNNIEPSASKKISVVVEFLPEIYLPNRRISQYMGKETIMECRVTANPQVYSAWTKNGRVITNNKKYKIDLYDDDKYTITLSLRIINIEYEDYGIYRCEAKNNLGSDNEEMFLSELAVITEPPTTTQFIYTQKSAPDVDFQPRTMPPYYTSVPKSPKYPKYRGNDNLRGGYRSCAVTYKQYALYLSLLVVAVARLIHI